MAKNFIACACARRIESRCWRTGMQCHCISASQPPLVAACYCHYLLWQNNVVYLLLWNLVAFSCPICLKMLSPTLTRKDHWSWKKSQAHPTVSWVRQWLRWNNWLISTAGKSSNTTKTIPECDQVRRCGNAALSSHNYPSEVEVTVLKFDSKL